MSTSDQQGQGPLTRKQLREIRLTGSTPVISAEEAAAAAETAPPAPPVPEPVVAEPDVVEPAEEPAAGTAPEERGAAASGSAPLTRRQAREQERIRTASVPLIDSGAETADRSPEADAIVAGVPEFPAAPAAPSADTAGDDDDVDHDEIVIEPIRASEAAEPARVVPLEVVDDGSDAEQQRVDGVDELGLTGERVSDADDVLTEAPERDEEPDGDARPTVNSAFGEGVLADASEPHAPFRPSFDELLGPGDSAGSQHTAPSALIFTPSPGEGSLSGPVASTGEILVTGSYELPRGLGSQGHAHGTTDGRDVDAVLIDGELPPASSPTPIAASAAVSTIKPAGEVIRPPAPEKGNKLIMIMTIVAGGLALAVAVAVIVAFSTNVF
ncbi:hypothetical protein [Microbacterium sp. 179-I 3D3 NHS]|uniref:hypothetical protein n=1 Tax=Microbacterium sp. 179-I 3D3 NHS TaxID=3142382 RepID=UPI0039A3B7BD